MPPMVRTDLHRLTDAAHRAVAHLDVSTDAVALYRSAAARAEQVWPGDLGAAVACVLAIAAESRESRQLRGLLGEHHATIALACAVLARPLDQPCDVERPELVATSRDEGRTVRRAARKLVAGYDGLGETRDELRASHWPATVDGRDLAELIDALEAES